MSPLFVLPIGPSKGKSSKTCFKRGRRLTCAGLAVSAGANGSPEADARAQLGQGNPRHVQRLV